MEQSPGVAIATGSGRRWTAEENSLLASFLLALLSSAGLYYVNIFPAITNALMSGAGLDSIAAGQITSANATGAAFGAFAVTLVIRRLLAWKAVCASLLLALVFIDTVTILMESTEVLVPLRFLHGFLGGALVGLGFSVIARTRKPSVAFSLLLVVQYGGGALGLWLLPPLVPEFGAYVPFYALIIFCLVTLLCLPLLAAYPVPAMAAGRREGLLQALAGVALLPLGLTLLGLFLFQAANMALFAFIFGLGEFYGLNMDFMSPAIGIANVVSIGGAVIAAYTGARFRLKGLLAASLLMCSGGILLFLASGSESIYLLANCLTGVGWAFCVPYFLTMAASFDKTGQMAALGGFASKMGLAAGPAVAGYILASEGGYPLLVWGVAIAIAACLVISLLPADRVDSGRVGKHS